MFQPILLIVKICAVLLTLLIVDLIRRGKLKDHLGMVWLMSSVTVLILTFWYSLWIKVAHLLGIIYEPSLFFLAGLLFCGAILLYLTVMISRHEREKEVLVQQIGLLQWKLEQIEKLGKEPA
jgi:hypothetical protein